VGVVVVTVGLAMIVGAMCLAGDVAGVVTAIPAGVLDLVG
jgi:hypothetical protein